jgi:hypothetical protein
LRGKEEEEGNQTLPTQEEKKTRAERARTNLITAIVETNPNYLGYCNYTCVMRRGKREE